MQLNENREKESEMSYETRKQAYQERFENIIEQHQINIEDTLDKMICITAIKAIQYARNWQFTLEELYCLVEMYGQ